MREGMQGQVFGVMNAFSGGAIGQTHLRAGIMPYISASIIFSMLAKVSPKIEAIAKEGAAARRRSTSGRGSPRCRSRSCSRSSSTPACSCRPGDDREHVRRASACSCWSCCR
jgi:hypothetical protein